MSSGRSPPQDAGKNLAGNVEPFYTNEDVAVLHDIVVLAQELLPNLPERERLPTNALFNAYYDILPRVGVNADFDSRYARILFKIGGQRGQGTLYEKFEAVLSRMGIEIEFDLDENGEISSQLEDLRTSFGGAATGPILQDENTPSRGRQRRNSESSAWNIGGELPPPRKGRRNSFTSLRGNPISPDTTGQHFLRHANASQPFKPSQAIETTEEDQSDHIVGAWVASTAQEKPRIERGRSISTHGSVRIRRGSLPVSAASNVLPTSPSNSRFSEVQVSGDTTDAAFDIEQPDFGPPTMFNGHMLGKGSKSLMQTKASLVLQHHLIDLAKRQLRLWRDKAIWLREDNANLNNAALQKDKAVLLNLALESWRNSLLERRHIAETDQFFAHLEQRSVHARDLYLLHKAFTHWGSSAFEAVERTSIARRHIIKTRTFNAWRDITAINELKVRRQVIKKFFAIWKRRHIHASANDAASVQIYESNVVEKVYKQWVQKISDIKASIWWSENAKRQSLFHWNALSQSVQRHHSLAGERRLLQLTRNTWQIWRAKTQDRVRHDWEAMSFHQGHICSVSFRKWHHETGVTPAKKSLQTDVNVRLLRNTFAVWLHRSRQERHAATIDKLRIIREAWTNWRHKLRSQVLRARVDDHIILRSVYRWVLAERSLLAQRFKNQRLLSDCLHRWVQRSTTLSEQLWDQEDLAQSLATHKTRDFVLRRWHSRIRTQQQHEDDAANFHISRRLGGIISQWLAHTQHTRRLERWSRDADFYFVASKVLKRWKVSTEVTKREKRKAAYIQVRRITKMNLAKGVLLDWRHQTQEIRELHARGIDLDQNRALVIGMNIFDRWRARTEELQELNTLWRERDLRRQFSLWRSRTSAFQELEVEAIINFQERQLSQAIKRWSLLTLQLRSQARYAAEIREKNLKRSFRKTFVYWQQRTSKKPPARSSYREVPDPLGATPRAEIWSESEDDTEVGEWTKGLDDPIASTPIPGYLKTPSKRMERVTAAAARFSSTTPRAPLPSPFDRQMRAQYSGGLPPSVRKGVGKGLLRIGAGFADIAETSHNDDQEAM